ncbi:uncharacterized protein NPIL_472041 [Nephila pilipes]|uniref:Uncharacterized protein n=1 Tax=Nephila pilipes TaxID=299642 RepID=A0A8X6N497_NEPPI|nr:uncharacterized protein NPIL_472041 [Nephila pilipes]
MLHGKKSESILQWYNSLTTKGDVQSLAQFTDGSYFYDIVTSLNFIYPEDAKTETDPTDSADPMDVSNDGINTTSEDVSNVTVEKSAPQVATSDSSEKGENRSTDSQNKYDTVKKFIDIFYNMDSTSIINYSECLNGKELELAKVAVLLLSALVQNLLSTKDEVIYTTTLLDQQVQEDIKECLSLVITDNRLGEGPIKKTEFHRILSRPAGCKGTPRRRHHSRSSGSTEHSEISEGGKNASKRKKERASSVIYEDVQDSPMKILLESPKIQYKAAMLKKESELFNLRSLLHREESRRFDLFVEKSGLIDELEKKREGIEPSHLDDKDLIFSCHSFRQLIQSQKEEIDHLKQDNETLQKKVEDIEMQLAEKIDLENSEKPRMVSTTSMLRELELSNCIKEDKIADLKARVKALEGDVRIYQQMLEEINRTNRRNASRNSPKVPEVMSNIIGVDEKTQALLEKKEQELTLLKKKVVSETEKAKRFEDLFKSAERERLDVKREINMKINLLLSMKSDLLSYKEQLDFFQKNCTCLKDSITNSCNGIEQEVLNNGTSLNSVQSHSEVKSASTGSDELGTLWSNVSSNSILRLGKKSMGFHSDMLFEENDFILVKKLMQNLVISLQKKIVIPDPDVLISLNESISEMKSFRNIILAVNSLIDVIKQANKPNTSVTDRKNRSQELDPQVKSLISEKKTFEKEIESLKRELVDVKKHFKSQLEAKEVELKVTTNQRQKLQLLKDELNTNIDKFRIQADDSNGKYESAKKYIEKLKAEHKNLMEKFRIIGENMKHDKVQRNPCEDCLKLGREISEIQREYTELEQVNRELKATVRNLDGRIQNFEQQVVQLEEEKNKVEFKLRQESAYLSGTLSDRENIMLEYYRKALAESEIKAKALQQLRQTQHSSPKHVVSVNTYIMGGEKKNSAGESSTSFANHSIRSGFFQTADEEDFLNHSSLAEIHTGGIVDDVNAEDRLKELRRRNTLCLPHLQSSYPLEIQNMTPTEKKYYEAQQAPWQPARMTFISEEEREFYKKQEAQFLGIDSEDSRDSFTLKKRKATEDTNSTVASKKIHCSSSVSERFFYGKPTTPIQGKALKSKKRAFRTPSSIRRIISMPRKYANQ